MCLNLEWYFNIFQPFSKKVRAIHRLCSCRTTWLTDLVDVFLLVFWGKIRWSHSTGLFHWKFRQEFRSLQMTIQCCLRGNYVESATVFCDLCAQVLKMSWSKTVCCYFCVVNLAERSWESKQDAFFSLFKAAWQLETQSASHVGGGKHRLFAKTVDVYRGFGCLLRYLEIFSTVYDVWPVSLLIHTS